MPICSQCGTCSFKPLIEKLRTTEEEALALWGRRIYSVASRRSQQFFDGLAEGMGWPVEKVVLFEPARLNTAEVIDLAGNATSQFVPRLPYDFLN
jgi:hypothetical protein